MTEHCPILYWAAEREKLPEIVRRGDGRPVAIKPGATGPRGAGVLATPCAGTFDLAWDAAEQTAYPLGEVVLLIDRRGRITPEMVARDERYPGHAVVIDGQRWEIPVAVAQFGRCGLPQRRRLGLDGRGVWEVEDVYRDLCAGAEKLWRARAGELLEGETISEDEVDELVGAAFAVNYRLSRVELLALGLLDNAAVRAVVDALLDWPTLLAAIDQKKTLA